MQNKSSICGYGLNSQAGYLFERQRTAMRQNSFARARNTVTKRKSRDDDDSSSNDEGQSYGAQQRPRGKRFVLEGLKRMRVSPSPESDPTETTSADVAMQDGEGATNAQALIPAWNQGFGSPTFATDKWQRAAAGYYHDASRMKLPPTDPSCTAIVLFDPVSSIPRAPRPRVELVDSDEDDRAASTSDEEGEEPFCRFEEIHEEEEEPMEID